MKSKFFTLGALMALLIPALGSIAAAADIQAVQPQNTKVSSKRTKDDAEAEKPESNSKQFMRAKKIQFAQIGNFKSSLEQDAAKTGLETKQKSLV